ncbi:MAG: YncE family protein [Coriobacteriia bacterium]|nr:YncE family protein [Coriobacteriia bacterium]
MQADAHHTASAPVCHQPADAIPLRKESPLPEIGREMVTEPESQKPRRPPRSRTDARAAARRERERRYARTRLFVAAIAAVLVLAAGGLLVRGLVAGRSDRTPPSVTTTQLATTAPAEPTTTAPASVTPTASVEASWTASKSGQLVKKVKRFTTVPAPKGLAITPDNREVWVTALVTKPSIGIYDPKTGAKKGQVNLGKNGAVEVIFNRAGTRAYASQMQSHRVYEIDVKARRLLRTFNTKSSWTKVILLSPDEKKLYAANWSGDDVSVISLKSGKVLRRIKTADTPRGLYATADGKKLYIACFGEQTLKGVIQVCNLKTGKVKKIGSGRAMRHMVADEENQRLFTSDLGDHCIWVTDLKTDKTKFFAKTDHMPNTIDISPDGRVLFVSNRGANNPTSYNLRGPEWGSILLLDTRTGKPLDAIVGGNQCTALDVSNDGTLLAFSDFLDGKIRVYKVPPTEVLLEGDGGAYTAHLRKVRKDGTKLRVVSKAAGG